MFNVSPPQTSQHAKVRRETNNFSQLLGSIRETLTDN